MSEVEITKPGGIAGGVAADALVEASAVAGAVAKAASAATATMLPQERRMMILSLAGYFLLKFIAIANKNSEKLISLEI